MKTAHKQTTICVNGKTVAVDLKIRDLILQLSRLPGVQTFNSCQGEIYGQAYVQFGGEGALALLPRLASEILRQQQIWKRRHRHVCNGCEGMSIQLEVAGDGICLRWAPWDYSRVLRVVRRLAEPTKGEKPSRARRS
jgi:hypothetical protein